MKKSDYSRLHSNSPLTTAFFTAAVLFSITACNTFYTKDNYLNGFEQFVTQTEQNYTKFTNQDWENSNIKYKKFTTEFYQKVYSELTLEDQKQIGRLKVRYEKVKLKSQIKNTIQSIKDGIQQTVGVIEEVLDSTATN